MAPVFQLGDGVVDSTFHERRKSARDSRARHLARLQIAPATQLTHPLKGSRGMKSSCRGAFTRAGVTLWSFATRSADAQAFSIALIPDTQNYSTHSSYGVYPRQMQWLVNNRAARNIKFAVHLGDITNHDT